MQMELYSESTQINKTYDNNSSYKVSRKAGFWNIIKLAR